MRAGSLLCFFLVASSVAQADFPTTPKASPYVAPEGRALLVFDRPRKRLSEELVFSIVNERGECVGVLGNGWKIVVPVRPSTQTLLIVTGVAQPQVQLLKVKPTAGNTYVIRMRPRVDRKAPVELTIVRKGDQPLEAFPGSILESSPFRPNLDDCSAWVRSRRSKLTDKASAARREWNSDEELRSSQTVQRVDGWTERDILP
ncbi:MAG: hypothetical protein WBG86_13695 [Polyangiales bacterium]